MFREMRRSRQLMSEEDTRTVLERNTAGVLAVHGDGGYPYAVPVSYVFEDGSIYIHCAKEGHKMDAVTRDEKVSFCVIDEDRIVPEEFTTYFRSVIVFGKAHLLEGEEKLEKTVRLCRKYAPNESEESLQKALDGAYKNMAMLEIIPDHMSGKEAIEFVNGK